MTETRSAATVHVRLLGEPGVVVDGAAAELSGLLPRAIVARLALAAGGLVTTERLVADLWDEPTPAAAVSLRSYVSRLRSTPLGPALVGGRGGYRLLVSAEHVDLLRFRRLAASDATADDLETALALWTGEVLLGLDRVPFARAMHQEATEAFRSVAERIAERRLDRDDVRGALELIAPVAERYPDHEAPAILEATALGRAGRRTDALAAIDAFQRRRTEVQGLDPSAELSRLRQSIVRLDLESDAVGSRVEVVRHAVPLPLTVFVGREGELAAIRAARQGSRLVTLVGPGGVGKTRLAIEVARRTGDADDAEQWFLELAPLSSGEQALEALATLVGASTPTVEAVARAIDGRRGLLVLDNAEHLLAEITELCRRLLAATAGVGVLVTSRQVLGIPGERRIEVNPLLGAEAASAVRIFCDRADDVVPGLVALDRDRATVERLVAALDGLPLALELAAARLASMSLAELAEAVHERRLLAGDPAGDRQSGLLATIRWSTDLVTAEERSLLRQLAEFAGVFTSTAVREICRLGAADGEDAAAGALRVDEALAGLARASLVAVIRDEQGAVSYRLLESVKAAARQLDPAPDPAWSVRHAEWHAALVVELEPGLHDPREAVTASLFDALRPDLTAALENALGRGDRAGAMRLVAGLGWYWFRRGMLAHGRDAIERVFALPPAPDDADADRFEAHAHAHLAMFLFQLGEHGAILEVVSRGLALAERSGDPDSRLILLAYSAYWHAIYGDAEVALRLSDEAETVPGSRWSRSLALTIRGQALRSAGKPAQALDALTAATALAENGGDGWVAVVSLAVRSKVLMDLKRGREALALLLPITRLSTSQHDPSTTLTNLYLVAGASALVEQHAAGARLIGAAEALGRRIGWDATVSEPVDFVVYRDRVRQGLPPALWAALVDDGARLSLGDAVAFALRLAPFAVEG